MIVQGGVLSLSTEEQQTGEKDLAPQRLDRLLQLVRAKHVVRVHEVSETLGVSLATVRRDLEELERRGELRRVHGGAVSVGRTPVEPAFEDKRSIAASEKQAIAAAALRYVGADETIYLDGGSTVLELARLLRDRTHLTVVTNSLRAALELSGGGPHLILVGGKLRRLSQTLVGTLTRHLLGEMNFDKAFMGTIGLSLEDGLTTTDPDEAYTKQLVMSRAREVILLADSSKVGKKAFAHAGRLDQVQHLITDSKADRAFARAAEKLGVDVVCAPGMEGAEGKLSAQP